MKRLIWILAVVCAAASSASAQDADVRGKWELALAVAQGGNQPPATLIIRKDGDKLAGTLSSERGDLPVDVTVKEKDVTMGVIVQTQNGPLTIRFSGTVEGDSMKGSADFGGRGQGPWSAKRTEAPPSQDAPPPAAMDVTGTWTFDVTTTAGSGTPTMTLKQTGEKLTGHYSGQLGEAELAGTIKGSAIEFSFNVSVEGNAVHVVYTGVADKDAIKGTVKLADLAEGTFTAKRKP